MSRGLGSRSRAARAQVPGQGGGRPWRAGKMERYEWGDPAFVIYAALDGPRRIQGRTRMPAPPATCT